MKYKGTDHTCCALGASRLLSRCTSCIRCTLCSGLARGLIARGGSRGALRYPSRWCSSLRGLRTLALSMQSLNLQSVQLLSFVLLPSRFPLRTLKALPFLLLTFNPRLLMLAGAFTSVFVGRLGHQCLTPNLLYISNN